MGRNEPIEPASQQQGQAKKFGTLEGVFLPNILTILGVIMYLRQGMVMGQAGLIYGVLIILLANMVTFITALSLSAVSTNMRVKAGGAYYIISRSLGIEWGGCIGIPFAVSQTLSIALYTLGFAESLRMLATIPSFAFISHIGEYPLWLLGSVALAGMTLISLRGAAVVLKSQYVVFLLIIVSLIAIFAGTRLSTEGPQAIGTFSNFSFWQLFAIFFPAVTGIMSGVSLSGDLKDPSRSIPVGTLASVGVGLVVYLGLGLFLLFSASPEELSSNNAILLSIAIRPEPVIAGIWAATLSSGLGMILSAPRTLQALANDGILPSFLGRGRGANQDPFIAMLVALVIAEAAILMGNLDFVAPVLSMFFLATYGMLNLIAGLESVVDNPSYRPTIKVPWIVSLFGAACCFAVMFLINTPATIAAIVVIIITYVLLKRRHLNATWGDLRRGFWLSLVRRSLLQVERLPEHPKNWRPNIMVVSGVPQGRLDLVELSDWLGSRRGLVTLHHIMVGPFDKLHKRRRMAWNNLVKFIGDNRLNALPAVDVVQDRSADLQKVVTSQGFGSFQPNTVLLDWSERDELKPGEFEKLCAGVIAADKALLVLKVDRDRKFGARKRIDLWSDNESDHLPMLLILSYLISQDSDWTDSSIRLQLLGSQATKAGGRERVEDVLRDARIPVETRYHEASAALRSQQQEDLIAGESVNSDLVILPFPYDGLDPDEMRSELDVLAVRMKLLPSVLLVRGRDYVDLSE